MALCNFTPVVLSPRCEVEWGPFRANSRAMQSHGWEFAMERRIDGYYRDRVTVVIRHRDSGFVLYGDLDDEQARGAALRHAYPSLSPRDPVDPVIRVQMGGHETRMQIHHTAELPTFVRADMHTRVEHMEPARVHQTLMSELGVFRPWAPEAPELIVDPESITDLMERIKKLQDPELAEIRRRNRAREEYGKERVVAQVLAFAA